MPAADETRSRITLEMLLDEALERPEELDRIKREIETAFGRHGALLVLDMVGVSGLARRDGIVAFLLAVHRMRSLAAPIVEEVGGTVLEAKADDLVCLFADVPEALAAANEIRRRLASTDSRAVSFGVGYGSVLLFENGRIAGLELNLASKLGEDLAGPGEILLTTEARTRLPDAGEALVERSQRISGIDLTFFALRQRPGRAESG